MEVAVCRGVEGAGDGKGHAEARGGRGGGRAGRVGERGAVRGEVRAAEFDRGVRTLRHEVQRDPDDVMLRRVRVRDFLADVDLDVERLARLRGRGRGDGGDVLFRLPVGGLDGGGKCGAHGVDSSKVGDPAQPPSRARRRCAGSGSAGGTVYASRAERAAA